MNQRAKLLVQLVAWAVAGFLVGFSITQLAPQRGGARLSITSGAIDPQATSQGRIFNSDAGIMLKFIKPERAADFEATVAKLKEALQQSSFPERRRQGASWKVFRAVEPAPNGDAIYVFEIDPAIKGADYTVSRILEEAFPVEASFLYRRYADSYSAGQSIVDLTLIASFGDNAPR